MLPIIQDRDDDGDDSAALVMSSEFSIASEFVTCKVRRASVASVGLSAI